MELQLPVALQIALYAASIGIVVFVVGLLVGVLYIKKQIDRVIESVENLKSTIEPLMQETRVAVEQIRSLTERIHEGWLAMENALSTVRGWGREANRMIERSANVVATPVRAASEKARVLMKGMQTFFQVLMSRTP